MQPIHYLILALGLALIFSLFRIAAEALATERRMQFAQGRAAGRVEARSEQINEHNPLQRADLQILIDVSTTLQVAHKFWTPIPGTESYRRRVVEHLHALNQIASRIRHQKQTTHGTLEDQEKAA